MRKKGIHPVIFGICFSMWGAPTHFLSRINFTGLLEIHIICISTIISEKTRLYCVSNKESALAME